LRSVSELLLASQLVLESALLLESPSGPMLELVLGLPWGLGSELELELDSDSESDSDSDSDCDSERVLDSVLGLESASVSQSVLELGLEKLSELESVQGSSLRWRWEWRLEWVRRLE